MLVSVVMITYNQELYIEEAMNGVLNQVADFDIELIVADDHSSDNTMKVVEKVIRSHPAGLIVKYTRQQENIGMMPNFIWALSQAKGKYIALCEGDDYWTDMSKLQKQVAFLESNPDYVMSFHPVRLLEPDGRLEKDYLTRVPRRYQTIADLAKHGNYIHTPSVVYRNVLDSFPDEMLITPVGDFFLYMLLAQHGKIGRLNEEMAIYRHRSGNFSVLSNEIRLLNTIISFFLIRKVLQHERNDIAVIIAKRIFSFFNKLLPSLKEADWDIVRKKYPVITDALLIEQLKRYSSNYVGNISFWAVIKFKFFQLFRK